MTNIVIRDQETNEIVHSIDVTGKTKKEIEKVEMGLARNFDFGRFMFGTEE